MNQEHENEDQLFRMHHLTEYEELLFYRSYVKSVRFEIGQLKAEIDFLTHENNKQKNTITKLKNANIPFEEIAAHPKFIQLKDQLKKCKSSYSNLQKDNSALIGLYIQAKNRIEELEKERL